jgi:hypothetical protein
MKDIQNRTGIDAIVLRPSSGAIHIAAEAKMRVFVERQGG